MDIHEESQVLFHFQLIPFSPVLTIFPWAYEESNFQLNISVGALFCRDCVAMKRRKYDHTFQRRNITYVSWWWIGTSRCNWPDTSTCTYRDSSSYYSCQSTTCFRLAPASMTRGSWWTAGYLYLNSLLPSSTWLWHGSRKHLLFIFCWGKSWW